MIQIAGLFTDIVRELQQRRLQFRLRSFLLFVTLTAAFIAASMMYLRLDLFVFAMLFAIAGTWLGADMGHTLGGPMGRIRGAVIGSVSLFLLPFLLFTVAAFVGS